ncbi:MAG: hypothetical protein ACRDFX_13625, partial [Chloroflexota bacterium]
MFTRTLALLALTAGGLGALPHVALAQGTDAATISQAAARLSRQTPARVIRWLDTRRSVSDARIGSDGRSLEIRFRDGGSMAILPALGSYTPVSGASRLLQRHAFARSYQPSPNAPRALVLEPFATELGLGSQAGAPEITALQAAGFRVDQASDTQVTTGLMASLPNYNVVYMHTHTGVGPDGHGVLATGEVASCNPYTSPDGTIQTVTVAGNTSQCFSAITSRYVALHFGQFPAHALVFLNGCALLNSTEFMQGLADKGVGVTLSWDNDSTARDGFLSGAAFFNEMGQGDSVSAALSALRNAGYGTSDVQG